MESNSQVIYKGINLINHCDNSDKWLKSIYEEDNAIKKCNNCLHCFVCQEFIVWQGLGGKEPDADKCTDFKEGEK